MGIGIGIGVVNRIRVRVRIGVRVRNRIRGSASVRVRLGTRTHAQLGMILIVDANITFSLVETAIHDDGLKMQHDWNIVWSYHQN